MTICRLYESYHMGRWRDYYRRFTLLAVICGVLAFSGETGAIGYKVNWDSLEWKVIHSKHFDIHYPDSYEHLGKVALLYAEEANILLSEKLAHHLSEVIPVYIYPSHGHFQQTNIAPGEISEGVGGFTDGLKKRVVVPFMGNYKEFRHVLTHELVHAFQFDILFSDSAADYIGISAVPKTPLWAIEGMAEYFSEGWTPMADMFLRDAVLSEKLPTLKELSAMQLHDAYLIYKGGQSVIYYMDQVYGSIKVAEFLKDTRDQQNLDDVFRVNFGISMERFDQEWRLWLKRRYFEDVERKVDHEQTRLLTAHFIDKSYFNRHPAISPDGKRVVYITVRDYLPVMVMRPAGKPGPDRDYSIGNHKEPEEEILLQGENNGRFKQLHLLDNNISFTPDSKQIFFCARSGGKDRLYLFDLEKRVITKEVVPEVDMVQYPRLSADGKYAVFSGIKAGASNLFTVNLESGRLRQVSDDYFAVRDPSFSLDMQGIYYSGNDHAGGAADESGYRLIYLDLATGKKRFLTPLKNHDLRPIEIQPGKVLYISDMTGIFNLHVLSPESGEVRKVSDTSGGILSVSSDRSGETYAVSIYRNQGYDIGILRQDNMIDVAPEPPRLSFAGVPFPSIPENTNFSGALDYTPRFSLDWFFFGLQYSEFYGLGGFIFLTMSEYLGDHSFEFFADYISERQGFNFQAGYSYLRDRIDWHFSVFRASNYYSIFNLADITTINELFYNPKEYSESIYRFGGNVTAIYPLNSFWLLSGGLGISRYEERFRKDLPPEQARLDVVTNIFALNARLLFNNVLYSPIGPLKGIHLSISDEQSFNITGEDYIYNKLQLDFRNYFLFFDRYIFVTRLFGGIVSGPQSEFFPWYLGGYNSLRGYHFMSIYGKYAFLANLELRFPLVDYIIFGLPAQWALRGFSGVLFFDAGAAFHDFETVDFFDEAAGVTKDLKLTFGLGIRIVLFPGIMIKVDWATPWNLKTALRADEWTPIFSIGYEY